MAAQVFTVDYEFPSFIIRASDILTGQPINELKLSVLPQSVCVSPRGDCIALATQKGTMLLDPVSLSSTKTLATGDTTAVTYSPSEPLLVAGRMDSKLAWFSFPDIGQAPAVNDTCVPGVVRTVCFTLSGNTLAAGMSSGGLVIIVDADSRQNTKVIETRLSAQSTRWRSCLSAPSQSAAGLRSSRSLTWSLVLLKARLIITQTQSSRSLFRAI